MITGETLIKGLFYFLLKARGGKYLSRKEIVNKKTGKKSYQYTYANKKGEKSKAPQEQVKQPKPKADKKGMDKKTIVNEVSKLIAPLYKNHVESQGMKSDEFESGLKALSPKLKKIGLGDSQIEDIFEHFTQLDIPESDKFNSDKETQSSLNMIIDLPESKQESSTTASEAVDKKQANDPISQAYANISPQNKFPEKRITKSISEYKNKAKEFISQNKPNSENANVNGITVMKNPRGNNYELYHKPEGSKTTDIYPLGHTVKNQEEAIAAALALSDLNKK